MGVIKSALVVWNFEEKLNFDQSLYKTGLDLKDKLDLAVKATKDNNIAAFKALLFGSKGDKDNETKSDLWAELAKLDKKCSKILLFVTVDGMTGGITKKRLNFANVHPLHDLVSLWGYTPTPKLRVGVTSTP
jgi:hypothetical protein